MENLRTTHILKYGVKSSHNDLSNAHSLIKKQNLLFQLFNPIFNLPIQLDIGNGVYVITGSIIDGPQCGNSIYDVTTYMTLS